jgi:hypothetical protein
MEQLDVSFDLGDTGAYFGDIGGFDAGTFDLDFTTDEQQTEMFVKPHLKKAQTVDYSNAIDMCRELRLCDGFRMFAFVAGNFVFGDLLEAMTKTRRWTIEKMTIQTLSLNRYNIDSIANIVRMSGMSELRLVISYYWYANYLHAKKGEQALVPYLFETLEPLTNLSVAIMRTHSKVVSVLTKKGGKVVIHGSANLRSSDNVEQVCIECDPDLYDFVETFADEAIAEYDVVKANGRKTLGSDLSWRGSRDRT